MAIQKRFIHFKKFSDFNAKKLSANEANTQYTIGVSGEVQTGAPDILYQSYCWIKDTKQQWTHGQLYDCSPNDDASSGVYITPFTLYDIEQTYRGEITSLQWDYPAMMDAIYNNATILIPYDSGLPGYSIVSACYYEDRIYFTIPTTEGGTEYAIDVGIGNEAIGTSDIIYFDYRNKQDTLVSGTNIKTINGNPILGSGNIEMPYYEGGEYTYVKKGISDDQLMYALPTSADDSEDDTIVTKHFLKTINGQSLFGSGDIAPSGYERKVTVNPGMTCTLAVDDKYMLTNILSGQLTIQLPTTNPASDNYAKECGITFTTGSTAPTIIFNGNVWWVNGTAPTIDANSVYEFSFKFNFSNNTWLGVYASFKNE